jgi:hypothetical protein
MFNDQAHNVINMQGDDGVDILYVESNGAGAYLDGGAGLDYIMSYRSDVYAEGGPGDDTIVIHGSEGTPFISGSEGNDSLSYSGPGDGFLVCSDGTDQWCGGTPYECESPVAPDSFFFGKRRCP